MQETKGLHGCLQKTIISVFITTSIASAMEVADYVPDCAVAGVQYGAGFGAVAGGLSGAAALTGSGISGSTLAACPSLAMATVSGTGGAMFGGPLIPIGGLLAGAALGGLAGGSTGGYVQCRRRQQVEQTMVEEMREYMSRHPKGAHIRHAIQMYMMRSKPDYNAVRPLKGPQNVRLVARRPPSFFHGKTPVARPYNSKPTSPFTPGATADATKELELNNKPFGYFKLPVHVFDPDADSFISETQQLQPTAGNHEETMQQSKKVTSEAHMNETLHDLQRVNVDAMLAEEVMSFLKDFKDSRESEKNQDQEGVSNAGGHDDSDPDDLTFSGTNYSPSPPQQFEGYDSGKKPQKRPKAITFEDEKSLGQQYLQKYQELRHRRRQPLVYPRGAYGQRLPDDVVIYDKDPNGSFGHGYTEEAARFEPSAAEEPMIDYEYFDTAPSTATAPDSAHDFGVGRYTRHMASDDRLTPATTTAAPTTEYRERDRTRQSRTHMPRARQHRKLTEPYTLQAPHPFAQKVVTVTKEDWIEEMKERELERRNKEALQRSKQWQQLKAFYRDQETQNERQYIKRYLASNDSHKELLKKILLSGDDESRTDQESEQRSRARRREPPTKFFDRRRSNANAN